MFYVLDELFKTNFEGAESQIYFKREAGADKTTFFILLPGAESGSLKVEKTNIKINIKRPAELVSDFLPLEDEIIIPFNDSSLYDCKNLEEKKLEYGILKVVFKKVNTTGDEHVF